MSGRQKLSAKTHQQYKICSKKAGPFSVPLDDVCVARSCSGTLLELATLPHQIISQNSQLSRRR